MSRIKLTHRALSARSKTHSKRARGVWTITKAKGAPLLLAIATCGGLLVGLGNTPACRAGDRPAEADATAQAVPTGTAYYVSPEGSDLDPGTLQRPFRTVAR